MFWHLLSSNVWDLVGGSVDKIETGVLRLRADIFRYYALLSPDDRRRTTEIEDLTIKMLGSKSRPKMKLKAAECKGLTPFCVWVLDRYSAKVGGVGHHSLQASKALAAFDELLDISPQVIQEHVAEERMHIVVGI